LDVVSFGSEADVTALIGDVGRSLRVRNSRSRWSVAPKADIRRLSLDVR
jgi:hypothetical protein